MEVADHKVAMVHCNSHFFDNETIYFIVSAMACISGFMYQCLYKMVSLSGDHIGLKYSKHPVYHTYFE